LRVRVVGVALSVLVDLPHLVPVAVDLAVDEDRLVVEIMEPANAWCLTIEFIPSLTPAPYPLSRDVGGCSS
jgi:hypothetical protein